MDEETLCSKTVVYSSTTREGEGLVDCNVVNSSYKGVYKYVVMKQERYGWSILVECPHFQFP